MSNEEEKNLAKRLIITSILATDMVNNKYKFTE